MEKIDNEQTVNLKENQILNNNKSNSESNSKEELLLAIKNLFDNKKPVKDKNELNLVENKLKLNTINRFKLDFDFEKKCSVTFSKQNVYCCLVCGKYLQGKSPGTVAYSHSLELDHSLFICLTTQKFFQLPDMIEFEDNSLDDIKMNLKPTYSLKDCFNIDNSRQKHLSLEGVEFTPGTVGLNNLKKTDYVNVIIQSFVKIKTLRNFFLLYNYKDQDKNGNCHILVEQLSDLIKKMFNFKNFKAHVSPHEVLQAILKVSEGKFKIQEHGDIINFLSWLLNVLDCYFLKRKNLILKTFKNEEEKEYIKKLFENNKSPISTTFQGSLTVESFEEVNSKNQKEMFKIHSNFVDLSNDYHNKELSGLKFAYTKKSQHFYFLNLNLPQTPLFKDSTNKINIPQINIYTLFEKFNGKKLIRNPKNPSNFFRYSIEEIPNNLILIFQRFEKNKFYTEKNNTIVNYPLKELELPTINCNKSNKYSLVSNIIHEGNPDNGSFLIQTKIDSSDEWCSIQDLIINPILPLEVEQSESFIHFYEGVIEK